MSKQLKTIPKFANEAEESRRSGKLFMPDIHTHQNVGQRKAVARPYISILSNLTDKIPG